MSAVDDDELRRRLAAAFPDARIEVEGDGYHYRLRIVDAGFEGQATVARHRRVYAPLAELIADGRLHALHITALTPQEAGDA